MHPQNIRSKSLESVPETPGKSIITGKVRASLTARDSLLLPCGKQLLEEFF